MPIYSVFLWIISNFLSLSLSLSLSLRLSFALSYALPPSLRLHLSFLDEDSMSMKIYLSNLFHLGCFLFEIIVEKTPAYCCGVTIRRRCTVFSCAQVVTVTHWTHPSGLCFCVWVHSNMFVSASDRVCLHICVHLTLDQQISEITF